MSCRSDYKHVGSFIIVPSKEVIIECEATIAYIKAMRAKWDAEFITEQTQSTNFWRRLFFLRPKTEEEVRAAIDKQIEKNQADLAMMMTYPSCSLHETWMKASILLGMAQTQPRVFVSRDDFAAVWINA